MRYNPAEAYALAIVGAEIILRWLPLGTPSKPRGFRYKESGDEASIRKVIVEDDRLTVTGGKAAFCYTLDEDQQERYSLVWEYNPIQFVQSRVGVRRYNGIPNIASSNRDELFAELHVYF